MAGIVANHRQKKELLSKSIKILADAINRTPSNLTRITRSANDVKVRIAKYLEAEKSKIPLSVNGNRPDTVRELNLILSNLDRISAEQIAEWFQKNIHKSYTVNNVVIGLTKR